MDEKQLIQDLTRINGLEAKIELLIGHFEEYIQNRIPEKAAATEKVLRRNLEMIIGHLEQIRLHLKTPKMIRLVKEEEQILENIKATVKDLMRNPDNIRKDDWKIRKLEEFLRIVRKKEEADS